jgi:hypothetical protein
MATSEAPPNLKLLLIGNSSYVTSLLTWTRTVLIGLLQRWEVVAINALYGCTVPTGGESAVMPVWMCSECLQDESSATIGVDFRVCKLEVRRRVACRDLSANDS